MVESSIVYDLFGGIISAEPAEAGPKKWHIREPATEENEKMRHRDGEVGSLKKVQGGLRRGG
jgi:hypothetical protein